MDRTRTSRNPSSHNCSNRSARAAHNGGDNLETKFAFTRFSSNRNHFARDFRSTARSATILISGSNQGAAVSVRVRLGPADLKKMAVRDRYPFVRGDVGKPGGTYGNAVREPRRALQRNLETRNPGAKHGLRFPSWIPGFQICLPPLLPEQLLFC